MYVNLQKHMKKSLKIFVAAKFFKFLEFSETRQLGVSTVSLTCTVTLTYTGMLRFIPLRNSLVDDAPGYHSASIRSALSSSSSADALLNDDASSSSGKHALSDNNKQYLYSNVSGKEGPICWKCSGKGETKGKHQYDICKICRGSKNLSSKILNEGSQRHRGIKVTMQSMPSGWLPSGPPCANKGSIEGDSLIDSAPDGVQLCVLIGDWRIFQCIGGHRWTTDDLVTAWVAGKTFRDSALDGSCSSSNSSSSGQPRRALDLGCGNGSVLLMMAWQFPSISCVGMEARREAVKLAKRSVAYNCGSDNSRVRVVNRDFRWIYHKKHSNSTRGDTEGSVDITEDAGFHEDDCHNDDDGRDDVFDNAKFDIITGTPPYFKVDFDVDKGTSVVHQAIIREGGMPTCKESAPARCEFRGGIEAYCKAASVALSSGGVFTVCENWMNHGRVLTAASASRLTIFRMQRVVGREGKPPLFCVYSMTTRHRSSFSDDDDDEEEEKEEKDDRRSTSVRTGDNDATASAEFEDDLIVRDRAGAWTAQYLLVLRDLSYPTVVASTL